MPYVLLLLGIPMFVSVVRGTEKELGRLVEGDFTGSGSFLFWVAAIAVVGGAGYIKPLRPLSIAFMSLLLFVLFIKNKGVVSQLQSFVNNPQASTAA